MVVAPNLTISDVIQEHRVPESHTKGAQGTSTVLLCVRTHHGAPGHHDVHFGKQWAKVLTKNPG